MRAPSFEWNAKLKPPVVQGDRKNAHIFDRAESRCRVTVYGIREMEAKKAGESGTSPMSLISAGSRNLFSSEYYLNIKVKSDLMTSETVRTAVLNVDSSRAARWNYGEGEQVGFDMLCNLGQSGALPPHHIDRPSPPQE